jgi:hypothetical protein
MKKCVNGKIIDLTPEEIAAVRKEQACAEAYERKRPLSEAEVTRMIIAEQINTLAVDDATALRMREYYPDFDELVKRKYTAKDAGYKFRYGDILYKTAQPNIAFVAHYPPGVGMESMYTRIDETHDGSEYDPVPFASNMVLELGKYYTDGGVLYYCYNGSGNAVHGALAHMAAFVEVVQQ